MRRPWHLLFGALLAFNLLAYAAIFLRYLGFPYEVFGWSGDIILYNATQLARGELPWHDPAVAAPVAFLYAPGYTFLLAPLVALFGSHPATARLLTLAGILLLCVALHRETRRRTGDRFLAWCAPGVLFLLSNATLDVLLWVHPDTWSVTFGLLALLAVTPRGAPGADDAAAAREACTTRAVLLAAVLSFAAMFTKQTAVGVAGAIALYLLVHRPRAALLYVAATGALTVGACALLDAACEGGFLPYLFLPFSHALEPGKLGDAAAYVARNWGATLPLLAALLWLRGARARWHDPLAWAAVLALPGQVLGLLKANGAPNNLLGLTVVLVPLLLEAVAALRPRLTSGLLRTLAALLLLAVMAPQLQGNLRTLWRSMPLHDERLAVAHEIETTLAAASGPVWVSYRIDFAYRNGLPVELPLILLVDFLPAYPHVADAMLARLDAGEFETLLIPGGYLQLLPDPAWKPRIMARYRVERVIGEGVGWGSLTPLVVLRRR